MEEDVGPHVLIFQAQLCQLSVHFGVQLDPSVPCPLLLLLYFKYLEYPRIGCPDNIHAFSNLQD